MSTLSQDYELIGVVVQAAQHPYPGSRADSSRTVAQQTEHSAARIAQHGTVFKDGIKSIASCMIGLFSSLEYRHLTKYLAFQLAIR